MPKAFAASSVLNNNFSLNSFSISKISTSKPASVVAAVWKRFYARIRKTSRSEQLFQMIRIMKNGFPAGQNSQEFSFGINHGTLPELFRIRILLC